MRKALPVLAVNAAIISALTACGGSHDSSTTPKTLLGNWHQTNSKATGVYSVAAITGDGIQINTVDSDATRTYWIGSFNGDLNPNKPFKYTSLGNPDAMAGSIFTSPDKYKSFDYKNGVLSYNYQFAGMSATIKLVKDKKSNASVMSPGYVPDGFDNDHDHYAVPRARTTPNKPAKVVSPPRAVVPPKPVAPAPAAPPRISIKK